MVILETSIFTRQVTKRLSDDEYCKIQIALNVHPDLGAEIPGSGGLRKLRWGAEGKGKSGGVRVIYYWIVTEDLLIMLYFYFKNEQADLTDKQIRILRRIVEEELR